MSWAPGAQDTPHDSGRPARIWRSGQGLHFDYEVHPHTGGDVPTVRRGGHASTMMCPGTGHQRSGRAALLQPCSDADYKQPVKAACTYRLPGLGKSPGLP